MTALSDYSEWFYSLKAIKIYRGKLTPMTMFILFIRNKVLNRFSFKLVFADKRFSKLKQHIILMCLWSL